MARIWTKRESPVRGKKAIEVKPTCRDWSPASERNSASSSGENGSRLSRAKSAPSRLLDCIWILDCKFSRKEKAATTAATAKITLDIDSSNGFTPRRRSRRASCQIHACKGSFIVRKLCLSGLGFRLVAVQHQPAATQTD